MWRAWVWGTVTDQGAKRPGSFFPWRPAGKGPPNPIDQELASYSIHGDHLLRPWPGPDPAPPARHAHLQPCGPPGLLPPRTCRPVGGVKGPSPVPFTSQPQPLRLPPTSVWGPAHPLGGQAPHAHLLALLCCQERPRSMVCPGSPAPPAAATCPPASLSRVPAAPAWPQSLLAAARGARVSQPAPGTRLKTCHL